MVVEWQSGASNDCVFASWEVERQDGISLVYVPASGTCADLTKREETVCEDAGLRSYTQYRYRVRETCGNGGSSFDGESEIWVQTLPTPASPPILVAGTAATTNTITVEWADPESFGDCDFNRWRLEMRNAGGAWVMPLDGGCSPENLRRECHRSCVADGLQSNSGYDFRVLVDCVDPVSSSAFSERAALF